MEWMAVVLGSAGWLGICAFMFVQISVNRATSKRLKELEDERRKADGKGAEADGDLC